MTGLLPSRRAATVRRLLLAFRILAVAATASGLGANTSTENPLASIDEWTVAVTIQINGTESHSSTAGERRETRISRSVELTSGVRLSAAQAVMIDTLNRARSENPDAVNRLAALGADTDMSRRLFLTDPKNPDQIAQVTVNDEQSGFDLSDREGGGPPTTWTRTTRGRTTHITTNTLSLTIDLTANTFDLAGSWSDSVPTTITTSPGPTRGATTYATQFRLAEHGVPIALEGKVIHGSRPLTLSDLANLSQSLRLKDLTGTLSWTLKPAPPEPLELVVSIPGYDEWIPEASERPDRPGSKPVTIRAEVRRRDGEPVTDRCQSITFRLVDVSKEPGVALNAPLDGGDGFDLAFSPASNDALRVSADGGTAATKAPGNRAEAVVDCYDWGAFGALFVDAVTASGQHLIGTLRPQTGDGYIRLPKRAANSAIADAWKAAVGCADQADTDDLDNEPVGDGTKGDGLSLYEEYRGFYVAGRHVRTAPATKDLFIRNRATGGPFQKGIAAFAALTHIATHPELDESEIKDRLINFNHGHAHRVNQHGIVIAKPGVGFESADPNAPKAQRMFYARLVAGAPSPSTPKGTLEIESTDDVYSVQEDLTANVVHELLHCCHVRHHGENDPEVQIEVRVDPKTNALRAWMRRYVNGAPSKNETPVTLLQLDGQPVPLTKPSLHPHVVIGDKGGRYSGQEDCVMRYHNADFVRDPKRSNALYVVTGKDHGGLGLCTSRKGTGINAASAGDPVRPWFGDARVGNCAGQIRVSDTP